MSFFGMLKLEEKQIKVYKGGKQFMKAYHTILFSILTVVLAVLANGAWSQTITLTAPSSNVEYRDGDEFATTVPGVPWDMNELRDIPFDLNFQEPTVSGGIWRGTNLVTGAVFYPLFKGYSTPTYTNYPSYYTGGMPYGPLNPIDSSAYRRLSIRLAVPRSARSTFAIFWFTNANITANTDGLQFCDGDYLWDGRFEYYPDGFMIYNIGITLDEFFEERVSPDYIQPCFGTFGSWTGMIYGFFVHASAYAPAGTEVCIDWIRLYNPETSPTLSITWETADIPTDNDEYYSVQLWLDSDNSGYDGDLFMTGLKNDGQYDLQTAALPPGDYYVYLKAVYRGSTAYETLAFSDYSSRIRILAPPSFEFTAPSYTSGVDYATTELDNPWDMSDASDINSSMNAHISNPYFYNGVFYATADPPASGATESDAQFYLSTKVSGEYVPMNASKYRYLTFRMAVDGSGYTNINDRVARGWVTRLIWGNTHIAVDGSESQCVPILEDWHSYTVDLWDTSLLETANPFPAQAGWKPLGTVNWLRLDPLEVPQATVFAVDDVKLCAENTPVNNNYTISWVVADPDSSSLTINLSYGYYSGTNFVGTAITSMSQAPGSGYYVWDTSDVAQGNHYIRAVVSDGSNTITRTSRVPVKVGGSSDQFANGVPVPVDYDGDGIADVAVYREASGYWIIQYSESGIISTTKFGASGYAPVPGDYDGDGKADPAVYCESGDFAGYWYVLRSSDLTVTYAKLGAVGYAPVPADYDGDGTPDLTVYCESGDFAGYWYILKSSDYSLAYPTKFGAAGYTPVPSDYDGDGKADLAVYGEPDVYWAYWYILRSSDLIMSSPTQFGATGYKAVPADYDGDGKADLAVYCESGDMVGYWFILLSGSSYSMYYTQLGSADYSPAPADYDGDGAADLCVYNSLAGSWYVMSLDGSVLIWE